MDVANGCKNGPCFPLIFMIIARLWPFTNIYLFVFLNLCIISRAVFVEIPYFLATLDGFKQSDVVYVEE